MKLAIKYDLVTGKIKGIIQVAIDSDLKLNIAEGEGFICPPHDHPFLSSSQDEWEIEVGREGKERKLVKKPETVIQKQKMDKAAEEQEWKIQAEEEVQKPYKIILKEINELRAKLGMPEKTLEDLRQARRY